MEEKYWISLINNEDDYYVLANKDKSIASKNTEEDMLDFFSLAYLVSQKTGINGNISAYLHNSIFNPSVVNLSMKEIEELFDLKSGIEYSVKHYPFGNMPLLKCNSKKDISKIFSNGKSPKLPRLE